MRIQLGDLGEWAAAAGTSVAVILSALTIRRDRRETRERDALLVVPTLGPVGHYVPNEQPQTAMMVKITNGSDRRIKDVVARLIDAKGHGRADWRWDEISPHQEFSEQRLPDEDEWAIMVGFSGQTFTGYVEVTFVDSDGKRWLRDTQGTTRRLSRPDRYSLWRRIRPESN